MGWMRIVSSLISIVSYIVDRIRYHSVRNDVIQERNRAVERKVESIQEIRKRNRKLSRNSIIDRLRKFKDR